jgi:hypothetical protein
MKEMDKDFCLSGARAVRKPAMQAMHQFKGYISQLPLWLDTASEV